MTKTVRGIIYKNGSITVGKGFKCSTEYGKGIYFIEFEKPFSEPPIVVCTIIGNA